MRSKLMRVLWLAASIFIVTLGVGALGIQDVNDPAVPETPDHHAAEPLEARISQEPKDDGLKQTGSKDVTEALSILDPLQPKATRAASNRGRGEGITGATWYYATEAFKFLFMNSPTVTKSSQDTSILSKPVAKAVQLLEHAAAQTQPDPDAIYLLAQMNLFGNFTHPRNYPAAYKWYQELASIGGNHTAQHILGFLHATGLGGATPRNQAKALMYHSFAAEAGNTQSQMTVAFRHHTGIGTPRNCDDAAFWYKKVADKAIAYARSGPPGGQALQRDAYRLADEIGGVYGEGASVVSSGIYANKAGPNSDAHAAVDDVLEYLDLMSRKGDVKATLSLGKLHYDGSRSMKRNLRTARAYFMTVARKHWQRDGSVREEDQVTAKYASKAAGFIGRMFLRGEGMEQSLEKALTWFRRGVKNGDALCQYELGLMHLNGFGVRKDVLVAADYFKAAADQDFASAQVNMGQLYLDQGSITEAVAYFELAARHGHIEAVYHLAELNNFGIGRDRSCGMATAYYKLVAEKAEPLHSSFSEANRLYDEGDIEAALLLYMMAAEQGYEYAQANVAYILDEYKSILPFDSVFPWNKPRPSLLRNAFLALVYWTRSAKQSNIDSMVKMGDYYFNGYGIESDMEKAAVCYQTAAETHQSAQALWNLGWIHENGYGVEQDYHLAKRFYDQALETNQESYLPVKLALLKLRARSFWNTITNGKINSIRSEPEPKKDWSFREWLNDFLEETHPYYHDGLDDDYVDSAMADGMPGSDEDYYDDIDESLVESLIILGLAGTLAFLVYYRNQRQLEHRRETQAGNNSGGQTQPPQQQTPPTAGESAEENADGPAPGQQPDGGFFPPQEHPNFGTWVAGGVGH